MSNSFNIKNCLAKGCTKVIEGVACGAYQDPTKLTWHRNDKVCPVAPWAPTLKQRMVIRGHVRTGQQKQEKGV